jgi:hypothetical protein
MIHPSHSRKELIEIIEIFQIYHVDNYRGLKKTTLSWNLWNVLTDTKYIKPDNEHYFISDVNELCKYLQRPSNRQIPNEAVREDVISRAKNLIFYAKCGFCLIGSNYKTIEDVIADARFIANYGDLPAARRALKLLNGDANTHGDPKMPYRVDPILTKRGREKLKRQKQLKESITLKFKIGGPTVVSFD